MAHISPFRAIHYNPATVPNLAEVITPPYDVIPPGGDQKYWARHPYNFAHIDLPRRPQDDYSASAELFKKWRSTGVLVQEHSPCYYLYRQDFQQGGRRHSRDTLICQVLLSEFSEGVVRPHENTYGKAKADRLQLMRKTQAQLSHIFGAVKDPEGILKAHYERWEYESTLLHAIDEFEVEHTLWCIAENKAHDLTKFFHDKPIYIVDGHHRYESSVNYAKELGVLGQKDHPAAHTMFAIANVYDPGLVVLPTHRVVSGETSRLSVEKISRFYEMEPMTYEELKKFTSRHSPVPDFALALRDQLYRLTPRHWREADTDLGRALHQLAVVWSDRKFLPELCGVTDENRAQRVTYEKELEKAWEKRLQAEAIIFHAPPSMEQVTQVADDKGFMPQKSTFFYPKLAAGVTVRDISS